MKFWMHAAALSLGLTLCAAQAVEPPLARTPATQAQPTPARWLLAGWAQRGASAPKLRFGLLIRVDAPASAPQMASLHVATAPH
jgi:hypothetical protein